MAHVGLCVLRPQCFVLLLVLPRLQITRPAPAGGSPRNLRIEAQAKNVGESRDTAKPSAHP